jgi:hypothetical protein
MILLKDGVKYFPYFYKSEEELATMVKEHFKEIFGENTLYFDPQTLKTRIGIEARSDGLILTTDQNQWYILEVELAEHSLSRHIVPQITNFDIAYEQPETRRKLTEAIYALIRQDPYKIAALQAKNIEDAHKYLTEIIETPPTIAIITDQKTPELDAVCKKLLFKTKTTEFQTYTRENAGTSIHIHAFESLFEKPVIPKTLLNILTVLEQVYKRGITYDEAARIAAKKLKLNEKTLKHDCTVDIGLTSRQLRKLIMNKEKLRKLVTEKFPDYEEDIREALS